MNPLVKPHSRDHGAQRAPLAPLAPAWRARYQAHRRATFEWVARSFENGEGGSCAHWSPAGGWSRPYPETTGYLLPTLLSLHADAPELGAEALALRGGEWLLSIQRGDGAFHGGLHPARQPKPSVFNTGQIAKGLIALYRHTQEPRWLHAAERASRWLAEGVDAEGSWPQGDYRSPQTPAYYTHVAWPMLEVSAQSGDPFVERAAERVLARVLRARRADGSFAGWGFEPGAPAFTHTIAYTLRGLLEAARLLEDWPRYGAPCEEALERLRRAAELRNGALPGAYEDGWIGSGNYTCLTGNAQTAINLLLWERHARDLRIANAAAKLVDRVCASQRLEGGIAASRGAVAGSWPLWGRYMALRYPNWAAKYQLDALRLLVQRLEQQESAA